ncbi:MAG TPA: hypothetical protein VH352_00220 [Pseudonocardiaceae bacterium]|nr:hypothetical protein [Pseudonocardiaceae bacterium]
MFPFVGLVDRFGMAGDGGHVKYLLLICGGWMDEYGTIEIRRILQP